tara:strand:+ start:2394 stop:3809 length:1416 start_codon:yes stop_codon:yes gene_type:complete
MGRATIWTTSSTIISLGILLGQLAILTRYFDPAVFGQFAIINLFIEIFTVLALGGISNFLIFKRDISHNGQNTIFALAILIGFSAFLIMYLLAPVITAAMGYPDLAEPLRVVTLLVPISALLAQYQAVALKEFSHPSVAKVDIVSRILAFGIAMATIPMGLFCLIFSMVSYQLIKLIGMMILFSKKMNFSANFDKSVVSEAFNYGIFDLGGQSLNILRRQLDIIILSVALPIAELGVYHVIKQLASRPAQALQPIVSKLALPAFAKNNDNPEQLQQVYLDFFLIQGLVLAFIYAPMIIASDLITSLLFGANIAEHHWVLATLACFWFVRIAGSNLIGPLVQAVGRTKIGFYWNLWVLPPNALVMYFASSYGVEVLTGALVIFQLILFPLSNKVMINRMITVSSLHLVAMLSTLLALFIVPGLLMLLLLNSFNITEFLVREISLAVLACGITAIGLKKSKRLRSALSRVKVL